MRKISCVVLPAALAADLLLSGCGTPGAPQPPSLNLPVSVEDLAATRAGNQITLTWTMPKKNTDRLLLKGSVPVYVCRKEGSGGVCAAAGTEIAFAPGADAAFTETLPTALAAGAPRPLRYFVELKNRNGRSAGLSNAAVVLGGEAPAPVTGLTAEVRKAGVVLRWAKPEAAAQDSLPIRLHRKLLTPPAVKSHEGLLAPQREPLEQNLLVEDNTRASRALDKNIRFGQAYEYRAQRVARIPVDGSTLELASELSAPVRVEALDIFPPETPTGLAAVATVGESSATNPPQSATQPATQTAIDLSWQPVSEPDLAGYIVYRREGTSAWQRISPAQPLLPPAFHDVQVQPGHTYRYAVSAIDQGGHESARSAEAEEFVPGP
jgi:hypothetical protein